MLSDGPQPPSAPVGADRTPGEKPLLAVLRGAVPERPPVWFMRQAGRYLPEYRALRAEKGGFLALVYDPVAAAEITLQPIRRFAMDGAILFSDILIIPHALGQELTFQAGEGPHLSPPLATAALEALTPAPQHLDPIYQTVARVAAALPPATTLLGFAGSPWTVATYMVHGQGSRDQAATRRMAFAEPDRFQALIDRLVAASIDYLIGQIDAGAEAVQLFDSWAGVLSPAEFETWSIEPTRAIAAAIHAARPGVPVIGFPKGAGGKLLAYAEGTGVDALGIDETVDPAWAARELPATLPVQGNLDPLALIAGGAVLDRAIDRILTAFAGRPHVFNLGHGIQKDTPIPHVEQALARIRGGAERA